jgi:regulator of telomere elongation helicase 1
LDNKLWKPLEIEELANLGKDHQFCPYYNQKDRIDGADLIFLPYKYLMDQTIRKYLDVNLTNTIIIIDEGHNIASEAESC